MRWRPDPEQGPGGAAEVLLSRFGARGWKSDPFEAMLALAARDQDELLALVLRGIATLPQSTTFVDAAVSLLPASALPLVADSVVQQLATRPGQVSGTSAAESVLLELSLQAPQTLAPHLQALWDLQPNRTSYYAQWPWRACPDDEARRLVTLLDSDDDRDRAWGALLQSRRPEVLAPLLTSSPAPPGREAQLRLLPEVGLTVEDGQLRQLCPPGLYHLVLPPDLLEERGTGPAWLDPDNHPTWALGADAAGQVALGGLSSGRCGACHEPLHVLVALDDGVPDDLGVSGLDRLETAACLSCLLSYAPQFFRHDADGRPHPVDPLAQAVAPEWRSAPLVETRCTLARTPARWQRQDWAAANGRQNLHRLGGEPTWVQGAEHVDCPGCGTAMRALLQLDSRLPTTDGDELYWGNGGLGYVLWCDACRTSAVTAQST